jgi:hypothetical protein
VILMDHKWAQELELIRKPAAFITTILDGRGQELLAGMRISDVLEEDIRLGGVVSLLWLKRRESGFPFRCWGWTDLWTRFAAVGEEVYQDGAHAHY